MNNSKYTKLLRATAEGAVGVAILVLLLTVVGELWSPLKDTLKKCLHPSLAWKGSTFYNTFCDYCFCS